jgi:hypothetical protein
MRRRSRRLPRDEWSVLIRDHHPGYIDWETYEANLLRIDTNTRPKPHQADAESSGSKVGTAVREGAALLQGLAVCGHCGRRLRTHYRGRNSRPGYHCPGKNIANGRGEYCLNIGGCQIDAAVSEAFLTALQPAGMEAARLAIRWRGGDITHIEVALPRSNPATRKTDEETIDVIRSLAAHHADGVIAGVLNRQGRRTVSGDRFTAHHVQALRHHRGIPCYKAPAEPPAGEPVTVKKAAEILKVAPGTVLRWIEDGFVPAEQPTPGAPWQIRITDELLGRFVETAPPGFVPMIEATKLLGVTRQTILQRVKRGELEALHIRHGRRKGLRIKVPDAPTDLFTAQTINRGAV